MKHINVTVPAALLLTFSLGAVPAFAQHAHSNDQAGERAGGTRESGGAQERSGGERAQGARPQGERAAPRAAAPPAQHVAPAPRVERAAPPAERQEQARVDRSRTEPARVDRARTAIPRVVAPRVTPNVVIRPRGYVRPFYRPYYSFRPRTSIGFGLFVGYPVIYPYYYPYPSPAPYPYPESDPSYGYPSGSVNVMPNNTGGLSFDISPSNAAVYVDGQYAGAAADFSSTMPPLALSPGRHYIDVRADGFEPIVFDADVLVGQVIPYQGTMRRQ